MAAGILSGARLLRPALTVLGLAVLFAGVPVAEHSASAQELIRRQNLFDRLFGGPPPRQALPPADRRQRAAPQRAAPRQPARRAAPNVTRRQPSRNVRRAPGAPTPAAPPPEPAIEKLENARVVLVVGDFLAGGLAEGLDGAYAKSPGVRIVDRTNGSSGFVRDDFYDWNEEIGPILEEAQPAVVVVMIGSNDRQQLTVGGQGERPLTEPWLEEYTRRVTAFAEKIEEADIPIVWTGLPPFRSSSMSSDMLAFNDIHKSAAEAAEGSFVDIWEGFVNEDGEFITRGPDMNGQPAQLRNRDGINLTRAGRRKIAFYVEKPLNKLLGDAAAPDIEQTDIENLPQPGLVLQEPADRNRTSPISLAGPDPDAGGELLGGSSASAPEDTTRGQFPASKPGRADDFSFGRDETPEQEDATSATAQ